MRPGEIIGHPRAAAPGGPTVLTGATGFVGSAALRALLDRDPARRVRVVGRTPPPGPAGPRVEFVRADLAEPASLAGVCAGADALVHAASYVGPDAGRCRAVNHRGGARLAAEARAAGVRRLVLLSTSAVYGPGPHRGIGVDEVAPAPVSAASRSRLDAEGEFLAAGAVVLRAGLVLGRGDRWVVPALAELTARVPARWDGGAGLLSAVGVEDLGRLLAATAAAPGPLAAAVHHASHPEPVLGGDLVDVLAAGGVLPAQDEDLPWDRCLELLRATPGAVGERQFALLARDHWYRSDTVWPLTGCDPGPGPLRRVADAAPWYRAHVQGDAAGRRASPA